jgi:hypothetical protein
MRKTRAGPGWRTAPRAAGSRASWPDGQGHVAFAPPASFAAGALSSSASSRFVRATASWSPANSLIRRARSAAADPACPGRRESRRCWRHSSSNGRPLCVSPSRAPSGSDGLVGNPPRRPPPLRVEMSVPFSARAPSSRRFPAMHVMTVPPRRRVPLSPDPRVPWRAGGPGSTRGLWAIVERVRARAGVVPEARRQPRR